MARYIQTGTLFGLDDDKIYEVYEFHRTINGIERGDLVYKWRSKDIINMLEEYKLLDKINDFGFKILYISCDFVDKKERVWKITYSVHEPGYVKGSILIVQDMDIKMRDIKLKKLLS